MQPHTSAAVSGGVATSAMIVIAWLFSLAHIAIPDSVQVALASLLTAGLGYFFHTHGQALAAAASAAADKTRTAAETAAGTVAVLLVLLLAAGLSGCTSEMNAAYQGYKTEAKGAVQTFDDNALDAALNAPCDLPYAALVRNQQKRPMIGPVIKTLCGDLSSPPALVPAP